MNYQPPRSDTADDVYRNRFINRQRATPVDAKQAPRDDHLDVVCGPQTKEEKAKLRNKIEEVATAADMLKLDQYNAHNDYRDGKIDYKALQDANEYVYKADAVLNRAIARRTMPRFKGKLSPEESRMFTKCAEIMRKAAEHQMQYNRNSDDSDGEFIDRLALLFKTVGETIGVDVSNEWRIP